MSFCVAIDGPAASGKGTIARALAERFGLAYLDTGLLYRLVGLRMLEGGQPLEVARSLSLEGIPEADLRRPDVAVAASKAAAMAPVREALVDVQRAFGRRAGGAVLDGRDIGTVICPNAEAKLFVTARDEVRAQRRFEELRGAGHDVSLSGVLSDLRARDARDVGRETAPLRPASDALVLDTSALGIEEAIAAAAKFVEQARMAQGIA